ncbi:small integral membrane protein 8-like isoform X1 [Tubulanus polymorphus]|uniref:small integral membrane protein 8-like isoform X1 n=2 Tax=Tubulanus polymorphus TaxID=672921 RepID=UPI003DA1C94E
MSFFESCDRKNVVTFFGCEMKSAEDNNKQPKRTGFWKNLTEISEPGFKKADATSVFKAVNFELYTTPNKVMVVVGLLAIGGCSGYIAYMNYKARQEAGGRQIYNAINPDGSYSTMIRQSKWD